MLRQRLTLERPRLGAETLVTAVMHDNVRRARLIAPRLDGRFAPTGIRRSAPKGGCVVRTDDAPLYATPVETAPNIAMHATKPAIVKARIAHSFD